MAIEDPFTYQGRFDSMEIDCSFCVSYVGPKEWPDVNWVSRCKLFNISLHFQLQEDGYRRGAWFCKNYAEKNTIGSPIPLGELDSIREKLDDSTIYRGCNGKYLFEHKI